MGKPENKDRDREIERACTIIGMASFAKKDHPVQRDDTDQAMVSPGTKARPACPLMASIVAKSGI